MRHEWMEPPRQRLYAEHTFQETDALGSARSNATRGELIAEVLRLARLTPSERAADERATSADLVRAAGCVCVSLAQHDDEFQGNVIEEDPDEWRVLTHDPRCPQALAAAIESRGKE